MERTCERIYERYFCYNLVAFPQLRCLKTVKKIVSTYVENDFSPPSAQDKKKCKRRVSVIDDLKVEVEEWIATDCSLMLDEIQDLLEQECSVRFSNSCLNLALHRWGYDVHALHARAIQRDPERTEQSRRILSQYNPTLLRFLDETHGDEHKMRRKYGWKKRSNSRLSFRGSRTKSTPL